MGGSSASKPQRCARRRSEPLDGTGKGYIDGARSPPAFRLSVAVLLVELLGGECYIPEVAVLASLNVISRTGQHQRTSAGIAHHEALFHLQVSFSLSSLYSCD